jgi:hypothetical protein
MWGKLDFTGNVRNPNEKYLQKDDNDVWLLFHSVIQTDMIRSNKHNQNTLTKQEAKRMP